VTEIDKSLVLVAGLSSEQRQSLLFGLDEDPVNADTAGLPSTALGDFGASALLFVASAVVLGRILSWVERQEGSVTLKLELFKIVKFEVNKSPTLEDSTKPDPEK
jgi:hypothetical protein